MRETVGSVTAGEVGTAAPPNGRGRWRWRHDRRGGLALRVVVPDGGLPRPLTVRVGGRWPPAASATAGSDATPACGGGRAADEGAPPPRGAWEQQPAAGGPTARGTPPRGGGGAPARRAVAVVAVPAPVAGGGPPRLAAGGCWCRRGGAPTAPHSGCRPPHGAAVGDATSRPAAAGRSPSAGGGHAGRFGRQRPRTNDGGVVDAGRRGLGRRRRRPRWRTKDGERSQLNSSSMTFLPRCAQSFGVESITKAEYSPHTCRVRDGRAISTCKSDGCFSLVASGFLGRPPCGVLSPPCVPLPQPPLTRPRGAAALANTVRCLRSPQCGCRCRPPRRGVAVPRGAGDSGRPACNNCFI